MSLKEKQVDVKADICFSGSSAHEWLPPTRQKEVIHEKIRRDSGGFRDLLSLG